MSSLWRQRTTLHPTFAALNDCLRHDWFLLPHELRLQRAHAEALSAAGILSAVEKARLLGALDELEREFADSPPPESDAEDLHTWIENELTSRAGSAGARIHTARSRNDQIATLLLLYVIDAGQRLAERLSGLIRTTAERATQWAELPLVLHTHQQFAAPGSVGFWLMRYGVAWRRLLDKLGFELSQWRRWCPLGSAAVAGSSIPIDRRIQARELGFEEPSPNALYSTSTRDECLEFVSLAAQVALHYQSLATDLIIYAQTPLAWLQVPAAFGTGSSMMPNKLNPDALELLRGEAASVVAAQFELLTLLKGLPSGYNRDLQCVKPPLRRAAETIPRLTGLVDAFLQAACFDHERLAAATRLGHIGATLEMERHVLAGQPLRQAHHAVADQLASELASDPDPATPLTARPLELYATIGSTHPSEVRRAAAALVADLPG